MYDLLGQVFPVNGVYIGVINVADDIGDLVIAVKSDGEEFLIGLPVCRGAQVQAKVKPGDKDCGEKNWEVYPETAYCYLFP
jgi:hypothetical protein